MRCARSGRWTCQGRACARTQRMCAFLVAACNAPTLLQSVLLIWSLGAVRSGKWTCHADGVCGCTRCQIVSPHLRQPARVCRAVVHALSNASLAQHKDAVHLVGCKHQRGLCRLCVLVAFMGQAVAAERRHVHSYTAACRSQRAWASTTAASGCGSAATASRAPLAPRSRWCSRCSCCVCLDAHALRESMALFITLLSLLALRL